MRSDGSRSQSAPLFDEHNTEIVRIGVVEDIEQRKRADLALRQSEEKFRILTETVPAAIFIYRGASLLYVNPTMEQFTGYSREELLRMPVWDVIHPDMREQSRQWAIGRQRSDKSVPSRYEVKLLTKDGATRWCDYTARLMEYDGAPAVLGVAVNIDDRIHAEAEAKRLHADLVHLSRVSTLGKLSTELAHELNQPLAAIMNYANGCRHRAQANQDQEHPLLPAIDEIRSEAERAAQIVKRIRNFARKRPMQRTEASMNDLILEATRLALTGAGSDDLPVRFDLAENLPQVHVDRVQIIQVLVNLVTNALEAMHEPGSHPRSLDIASATTNNTEIVITVSDAGGGFSNESADQLFEPFYTTKSEGLGLGLSISRSIVEAHGGRLWAESNHPSQGATFNLALPISQGSNYGA
jgi:two-component system sensor kinase FixL